MKITDVNYFLPRIEVLETRDIFESGRTKPIVITGICTVSHERDDYVMKLYNGGEMTKTSSCFELVAACIAHELDLFAPDPALAHVSNSLIESKRGQPIFQRLSNSPGINFASRYYTGYQEIVKGFKTPDHMTDQISEIFAFDLLISNSDRGVNKKTNMLSNGKSILIYDHELAFDFVRLLFDKNPNPWLIREIDMPVITKHIFYQFLKEKSLVKPINFRNFEEKLLRLNNNFWSAMMSIVPSEWAGSELKTIKDRIDLLVSNKEIFIQEINKILS